jgi:hypothetical protein
MPPLMIALFQSNDGTLLGSYTDISNGYILSGGAIVDSNDIFYMALVTNDNFRMLSFNANTPSITLNFNIMRYNEYSQAPTVVFGESESVLIFGGYVKIM